MRSTSRRSATLFLFDYLFATEGDEVGCFGFILNLGFVGIVVVILVLWSSSLSFEATEVAVDHCEHEKENQTGCFVLHAHKALCQSRSSSVIWQQAAPVPRQEEPQKPALPK